MLTLTRAGNEWPQIQRRMNKLLERLRADGYAPEWAYVVECNWEQPDQRTDYDGRHSHHVHALAYGDLPDAPTLTDHAVRIGFGPVVQENALSNVPSGVRYLWSPRKQRHHQLAHFLHMNGGRLQHSTRGFWRVSGQPVKGMDAAIRQTRPGYPSSEQAQGCAVL